MSDEAGGWPTHRGMQSQRDGNTKARHDAPEEGRKERGRRNEILYKKMLYREALIREPLKDVVIMN